MGLPLLLFVDGPIVDWHCYCLLALITPTLVDIVAIGIACCQCFFADCSCYCRVTCRRHAEAHASRTCWLKCMAAHKEVLPPSSSIVASSASTCRSAQCHTVGASVAGVIGLGHISIRL